MAAKRIMERGLWLLGCLGLASALTAGGAKAAPYYFTSINGGTVANQAIGESDLFFELSQSGTDVVFKFQNAGSDASITDIYFDLTGALFTGVFSLGTDSGAGVAFSTPASPPNLPSGNDVGFSSNYSADSNAGPPGVAANGIDIAGEFLNILLASKTVAQVETALASFALLVGIHVQSFPDGASMSLVNDPTPGDSTPQIPIPAALSLLLGGLGGLAWMSRRQRRGLNAA